MSIQCYGSDLGRGWKNSDPGSRINIPDPQNWIQNQTNMKKTKFKNQSYESGSEPGPLLTGPPGSGCVIICTDPDLTLFFSEFQNYKKKLKFIIYFYFIAFYLP
jgi:hypothetical protein